MEKEWITACTFDDFAECSRFDSGFLIHNRFFNGLDSRRLIESTNFRVKKKSLCVGLCFACEPCDLWKTSTDKKYREAFLRHTVDGND